MGYGLYVLSPARLGFFVTAFAKTLSRLARGHLPLGRQACTISPSASRALVSCAIGVHRISTHVRDDREAPLVSGETGKVSGETGKVSGETGKVSGETGKSYPELRF
jgi:hypothetical protein